MNTASKHCHAEVMHFGDYETQHTELQKPKPIDGLVLFICFVLLFSAVECMDTSSHGIFSKCIVT